MATSWAMGSGRWALILVGCMMAASVARASGTSRQERETTYEALGRFAKVLNYIQTTHVDSRPPDLLMREAIRGMLRALDDRSEFLTKEENEALHRKARRLHLDVGFRWERVGEDVRVTAVEPASPAFRRGVRTGHRLQTIDGASVSDLQPLALEDAMYALSGQGKQLVFRDDSGQVHRIRLAFAELRRPTVRLRRLNGDIGHLEITSFTESTLAELHDALDGSSGFRGLVLDLRGNTGGLVDVAARVADTWLKEGTIATTEARDRVLETFLAHAYGTQPDYPMATLVDAQTASASELLVAALQEAGRTRVVGQRTFGKGTVQTLIELEDGSALRLTISRFYSAAHRSVHAVGIEPDEPLPPDTDPDEALATAVRWIRRRL